MTSANLGVCFGPSLLRPEVETVSAIYDIKFRNAIVEHLITHYEKMFQPKLEQKDIEDMVGSNENERTAGVHLSNSLSSLVVRIHFSTPERNEHGDCCLVVDKASATADQ